METIKEFFRHQTDQSTVIRAKSKSKVTNTCKCWKTLQVQAMKRVLPSQLRNCRWRIKKGYPKNDKREKRDKSRRKKLSRKSLKRDMRSCVVVLLFASFVVFCSPSSFIVWSVYALNPDAVLTSAFAFAWVMTAVNSLINPFLYGLMNEETRKEIRKILNVCCRRVMVRTDNWMRRRYIGESDIYWKHARMMNKRDKQFSIPNIFKWKSILEIRNIILIYPFYKLYSV